MQREELIVYVRRASRTQIATAFTVAILLFAAFLATLPFSQQPLTRHDAFIPVISTVLMLGDGLTATILFSQASILQSRALVALAGGYLFSSLAMVPYALSFPGAFAPDGLIGGPRTPAGLYFVWHIGLPIAAICYAILERAPGRCNKVDGSMRSTVIVSIGAVVLAIVLLTLLVTIGHDFLPATATSPENLSMPQIERMVAVAMLLLVAAIAMVWRGRKSLLDIWLMVALWAWLLEVTLILTISERYSFGWYSGRITGMLSGVFVLVALLVESNRLYMQLALSHVAQQQQREGRLMSLDAAASAIAHEVKQPITAMVTNASAALLRMGKDPPDLPKVAGALQKIVDDGHRAADTIAGIRALFGHGEGDKAPTDLNQLIRETLDVLSVEIASRGIVISTALADGLPEFEAQRPQMRQLFVNLLTNAIDALGERPAGPRRITIRSEATEDKGVAIDITDSGRGIAADQIDRIFDAFFTTKAYGTGMGLPLCRSIVEGHGGKLWASSDEGRGTTFHILLPGSDA